MLGGVFQRVVAGHFPLADRGDDLQVGREGLESDIETHLIVALAGAAVGNRHGAVVPGGIDHQFGDEWSAQGGGERVFPLVQGARHEGREDEVIDKQGAGIHGDRIDRAGGQGLFLHPVQIADLTEIDGEGDHIEIVFFLDPGDHDRGVEPAGVGQDHFSF